MEVERSTPKVSITTDPLSPEVSQKFKDTHRKTLIDLCMAENKKLDALMAATIVDFHLSMLNYFGTEEYDHEEALKIIPCVKET